MTRPIYLIISSVCVFVSCVERDVPGGGSGASDVNAHAPLTLVSVQAFDHFGNAWPNDALPLRPRIRIESTAALDLSEGGIGLIEESRVGDIDDMLERKSTPTSAQWAMPVLLATLERDDTLPNVLWLEPSGLKRAGDYRLFAAAWVGEYLDSSGNKPRTLGAPATYMLKASAAPEAGVDVVAHWPEDGAAQAPVNLARAMFVVEGLFADTALPQLALYDDQDKPVKGQATLEACPHAESPASTCLVFDLGEPLRGNTHYQLRVVGEPRDTTGATHSEVADFTTSDALDTLAPVTQPLKCANDEQKVAFGCVVAFEKSLVLRWVASEPVIADVGVQNNAYRLMSQNGEVQMRVPVDPSKRSALTLKMTDLAGNNVSSDDSFELAPNLPTLTITEVQANPTGSDERGEYVEVFNFGDEPIKLEGFTLSDAPDKVGDTLEGALVLPARAYALIVGERFEPNSVEGLPPDATLIRVDGPIASGGLSNQGEPIFLRDRSGRRLSSAPAMSTREGRCLARKDVRERSGRRDDYTINATCTPAKG